MSGPSLSFGQMGQLHNEAMQKVRQREPDLPTVVFGDDFAPASADIAGPDLDKWLNNRSRWLVYGDHLHRALESALTRAFELGAPWFPFLFPLGISPYKAGFSNLPALTHLQKGADIIEGLQEQSPDWLCMTCYLHCANAAYHEEKGAPVLLIADAMFKVGATLRELELVQRNRDDAIRGLKVRKGQMLAARLLAEKMAPETERKLNAMRRYVAKGQSISCAAHLTASRDRLGTPEGNRKLYSRYQKKLGHVSPLSQQE